MKFVSKIATSPFLALIILWQKVIAPTMAPRCKYYPSCSHYTFDAIKGYGLFGIAMGAWRILRCNPWSYGGVDYVPDSLKLVSFTWKKAASINGLRGAK